MMNGKLDAKIAQLAAQIADEQANYKAAVAAAIHGVLNHYGLTLDDLVPPVKAAVKPARKVAKKAPKKVALKSVKGKRQPAFRGPQPAKYVDPETGATWSGFGKPPRWIAGAADRSAFLIGQQAA